MTVDQLKRALSGLPPDAEVVFPISGNIYRHLRDITLDQGPKQQLAILLPAVRTPPVALLRREEVA